MVPILCSENDFVTCIFECMRMIFTAKVVASCPEVFLISLVEALVTPIVEWVDVTFAGVLSARKE